MKQTDIKPCCLCGNGVLHTGVPLFYRITIERMGADRHAIERQTGLEMMLGGQARLANVMGPNENMANVIDTFVNKGLVCHSCGEKPHSMYDFMRDSEEEEKAS